jgi:hypothetical protein
MKFWTTALMFLCLPLAAQSQTVTRRINQSQVQPNVLIGDWYMGTMSGVDCNLQLRSNNTLQVQFGGCFHQEPALETRWKLQGDTIKLENPNLDNRLGSYLRIARFKNHFVLLPENSQKVKGQHKYSLERCFWRNAMKNGLQVSKDAPR